jgi:hypothetical protein
LIFCQFTSSNDTDDSDLFSPKKKVFHLLASRPTYVSAIPLEESMQTWGQSGRQASSNLGQLIKDTVFRVSDYLCFSSEHRAEIITPSDNQFNHTYDFRTKTQEYAGSVDKG